MDWQQFERDARKRAAGVVTAVREVRIEAEPATSSADAIAAASGFKQLGAGWRPIRRGEAQRILTTLLGRDLAYDHPTMPLEEAVRLAAQFVEFIGADGVFFTNGTWGEPLQTMDTGVKVGPSWDPVTKATFDAGVIGVGRESVAMLWVQDED